MITYEFNSVKKINTLQMNSKNVLSKIARMLNLAEATPLQAKTEDGRILQSSNFDVNDEIFEVGTDGKLTPLTDGEYTITFTDAEGKESTQSVEVMAGKIEEISVPETGEETETEGEMPIEGEVEMANATTEPAHALPNTTDEDPRNRIGPDTDDMKDPIISLSSRLEALEKICAGLVEKMESAAPTEGAPLVSSLMPPIPTTMSKVEPDEEEEFPKLDGAPIELNTQLQNKNNYGKKSADYQSSVLSKMYN